MIRRLLCWLGFVCIIVISTFWGFFTSLGWALWFNEKFTSIMFIGGFKTIQHMAAYPITHFSHPKGFDCLFSGAVDKCAEIEQALKEING